jgi:hypothetical protein
MGVQHVDLLDPEPLAALGRRRADHYGGEPLGVVQIARAGCQRPGAQLGRDHDLIVDPASVAPPPEQLLALAALRAVDPERVVVRGVDERPAGLDEPVEDRERGRLISGRAEAHRTETEHADVAARGRVLTDGSISHTTGLPELIRC